MGDCIATEEQRVTIKGTDDRNPYVPPACGSASMYERYGCRGEKCKMEHNAKMKAYREKRKNRG